MSQRRSYGLGTGLFIVFGFAALVYLATQTSSLSNGSAGDSYLVTAHFANVGQLKERAPIKVAGVRIGEVRSVRLGAHGDVADVQLAIDKQYASIPVDSIASIYTSGLLGDQYVNLSYGSARQDLHQGSTLQFTRPAQQLEAMLGKFMGTGDGADAIGGTYEVTADFSNVGNLSQGALVKLAGVAVGSVESVTADPAQLNAHVVLAIDKKFNQIPDDSSAAIFTNGLLGPRYVEIQPGGSPDMLKNGDQMILTQSAMQLEDLIGKFMVNGSGGSASKNGPAASGSASGSGH
ncbi:outer membrane lipid asymmetry maintenance protein MlaD [Frateuria aurantia]|uniref:ABC-type transport system involved in resistance to organic solvents, periplasmic component n=1 Tax=Frateuria aurantia (strain ATCC 33424 / DSM 6220 / KCTC 2777 / LMG 1558 / NBRC 3245 / NCIMB 13370) TaxID=767434 RepID=H8L3U9_FRAAD|nr:outer membrane lipid asymmetry maintenance protein MlaD [Frateuria aurantia]AFC84904.1 ABC-type transport system involved in resistance to organic solvents, periplasmic component [Frateuria aurantia DSM 6220]